MGQDHLNTQSLNLTPADLQAMIAAAVTAAVQESRKPAPPTEQQLAQLEMEQQHRKDTSDQVKQLEVNKRANQMICSHEHTNGDTHCVWVREENPASPGFILCQKWQCRIRPGAFNKQGTSYERDRGAIYDTAMFNRLFQKCAGRADMQ